ncbi:unnamed protein product [Coregonus sp. 'balchen']|nr:unnamed protein product [Coregonus sp. 'balchen']
MLHSEALQDTVETEPADDMHAELAEDEDGEEEEEEEVEPEIDPDPVEEEEDEEDEDDDGDGSGSGLNGGSDGECDGDELDDLPSSRGGRWKGPISRKASQTSVYLQEWDIPFEQLDLGELIGKEILSACWAYDLRERPTFTQLADMLEKLPKLNRRLSHPGHFWKSAEYVS